MDLIQELTNGTLEYKDGGQVIRHPPSAAMVRAAKILQQIDAQNTLNMQMLNRAQIDNENLTQQVIFLQKELNDANARHEAAGHVSPSNECIRETEQQVSGMACGGIEP